MKIVAASVASPSGSRHVGGGLIELHAYQLLEDAWIDGVAAWCRSASTRVLGGGRAWMVTASEGQGNWVRSRLLRAGVSLFGVQFLDARSLRRELCLRFGMPAPAFGEGVLEFLLRLHALRSTEPMLSSVARNPGACLAALDDLANSGWVNDADHADSLLPRGLTQWLPELRCSGAWTPEVDRQLLARVGDPLPGQSPLSVCVFGWDAGFWPVFDLLLTALRAADDARLFTPLPRDTSQTLQQSWLDALEETTGSELNFCESSGFASSQADLVGRLEGADLDSTMPLPGTPAPELLVGVHGGDLAVLARDFAARWLVARPLGRGEHGTGAADRLVILCPARNATAVSVVRALTDADIAVEDQLGEIPEPSLAIQIQRAILDYYQNDTGLESFLALIELLNEHAAVWDQHDSGALRPLFPLDAVEARRALHGAFADLQHHSVRVLVEAAGFLRDEIARPLRDVIGHLGEWPEILDWAAALRRWELCLDGFGLTTEVLEPLWSRLAELPIDDAVPSAAFFQYLGRVLSCGVPAQRAEGAANRFARVVVTTLEGASGQTWGGVLFLDSNEGAWPIYPPENPFLDDTARQTLNERRAAESRCHHLLTSADHAQLEHFRFLEVLENCTGPLAFGGVSRDPAEFTKELYPNEWALRCLVEGGYVPPEGETLLDRWRHATRRVERSAPRLGKRDAVHLADVYRGRRDPGAPFDQYLFNFGALNDPDELPFTEHWSARDLETVWNRPATFALGEIFDVERWRDGARELARGEGWMIGRLVHRWLHATLRGSNAPRQLTNADWRHILDTGFAQARAETEIRLRIATAARRRSPGLPDPGPHLSLWWQGVLHKAEWAARRCLEGLADAARGGDSPRWLCLDRTFEAELATPAGRLRLRAHCDALLLNRPDLPGAACQTIDFRTGAAPSPQAPTAAAVQEGRGIGDATLLFLALEAGAVANGSTASVIHPDTAAVTVLRADDAPAVQPVFERLAARQWTLCFGQRGGIVQSAPGRRDAENLPLATTPIDLSVLERKNQIIIDAGAGPS